MIAAKHAFYLAIVFALWATAMTMDYNDQVAQYGEVQR